MGRLQPAPPGLSLAHTAWVPCAHCVRVSCASSSSVCTCAVPVPHGGGMRVGALRMGRHYKVCWGVSSVPEPPSGPWEAPGLGLRPPQPRRGISELSALRGVVRAGCVGVDCWPQPPRPRAVYTFQQRQSGPRGPRAGGRLPLSGSPPVRAGVGRVEEALQGPHGGRLGLRAPTVFPEALPLLSPPGPLFPCHSSVVEGDMEGPHSRGFPGGSRGQEGGRHWPCHPFLGTL